MTEMQAVLEAGVGRKMATEGPPGTRVGKERFVDNGVHLPRNFNYHAEGKNTPPGRA